MEVGAGENVTTIRNLAEATLRNLSGSGSHPTLIRINPELPLADSLHNQPAVPLILGDLTPVVLRILFIVYPVVTNVAFKARARFAANTRDSSLGKC